MMMLFSLIAFVLLSGFALIYCGGARNCASGALVKKQALSILPVIFILSNLLYVVPVSMQVVIYDDIHQARNLDVQSYIGYFPFALLLNIVFILSFSLFYRATIATFRLRLSFSAEVQSLPRLIFWSTLLLFSVICAYMVMQLSGKVGGVANFILLGYSVTEQFNSGGIAVVGLPWLVTISLLYLTDAKANGSLSRQIIGVCFLALVMASFVIMGRRGALVGVGIALLTIYHFQYKELSVKSVIMLVFVGFVSMNVIGLIRGSSYDNFSGAVNSLNNQIDNVASDGNLDIFYTLTKGNFVTPFQSLPNIIAQAGEDIDFQWGGAALKGVSLLVPESIWSERPEPLSNWYMRKFVDSSAADNEGVQFYFLSGAYLDFGVFGPLLWGSIYGIGFAAIGIWFARHSPVHIALFGLFVGNMLNFIAAESVAGIIVFAKSAAAPCILILLLTALVRGRSGNGTKYA
jgi:oligosaccharide repeat unit polymerase